MASGSVFGGIYVWLTVGLVVTNMAAARLAGRPGYSAITSVLFPISIFMPVVMSFFAGLIMDPADNPGALNGLGHR